MSAKLVGGVVPGGGQEGQGRPLLTQSLPRAGGQARHWAVWEQRRGGARPPTICTLSRSWAQAPHQACGSAAPTCCCPFLPTQVSLRRLGTSSLAVARGGPCLSQLTRSGPGPLRYSEGKL